MERRAVLRILGGALALPALHGLTAEDAWAVGRALHDELARRPRQARVLTEEQMRTVSAIAERIIPATDTPGASEARVAEFIDLMLGDWYDESDRTRFLDGLIQVDARSRSGHGASYVDLAEAGQLTVLGELDAEVEALRAADLPTDGHFFQQMKWLTVHGYYTSEVGVLQELQWVAIPGGYDPCRAFAPRNTGGF
jgi:hypothetical protein